VRTRLYRWIRGRTNRAGRDSLTVFNFHGVVADPLPVPDLGFMNRETFLAHLEAIRRLYQIVGLREGIEDIARGDLRGPAAAVTFDDGLANFYEVAYPILDDFGIPAVCFLVTGLVGTEETLWYCRVHKAIAETSRPSFLWRGALIDLSNSRRRAQASAFLQNALKRMPPRELRAAVREIARSLSVDPDAPILPGSPYRVLSSSEICRMVDAGLVEFGSHTRTHPILSLLSPEEQREEIIESAVALRKLTGRPADLFAYPNGRKEDYDAASLAALRETGVRVAVTTARGRFRRNTPPLEIPRFWVGEETRAWEIAP